MMNFILVLLLSQLAEKYPSSDHCWDVLEMDTVAFEDQARFEMDWCIDRYASYYHSKSGDDRNSFWRCREAEQLLEYDEYAQREAQKAAMTVKELRRTAKYLLDEDACLRTREDHLRDAFEREHAKQIAIMDCMNAEDLVNYGPLGMGPYRKKDVDFDCWHSGWNKFAASKNAD